MSSRQRSRSPRHDTHDRRSSSPERNGDRDRDRKRDHREKEKQKPLPHDAQPISDSDYFLKNPEFRSWLKEEKGKYFDELSGEKARSYFRKFVKAWNRGKLSKSYYVGIDVTSQPAAAQTAYRWSFASKRTRAEQAALDAARSEIGAATRNAPLNDNSTAGASPAPTPAASRQAGPSRVLGPALPSAGDRVMMLEAQEEARGAERSYERKRARQEEKERVEDLVGPKERGREGMLEKKKMKREGDRSFREAKEDVFGEIDESTLMGGGDSFKARIAQRDAARKRFEEKRMSGRDDKGAEARERHEAIRAKDNATMDMFKQMAKERFGG
ncbi:hypothetical protein DFH11DRAFT_1539071 [Phellopilus nigrolimitatus]|nr:hypothetical protein DFH11DRAFT_1539071 [Phellopilus nigrolimitatus]